MKDRKAKKLMDQLVNKIPESRLSGNYATLKANGWFDQFDFVKIRIMIKSINQDKLMDRELKPPYVPPKDKLINDKEIKKMEDKNKIVIEEIKKE